MKLTPEKQAERDQVFSKIYAELPPEDKVRIDHIRAEGAEQTEEQRVEFDALITRLIAGNCRSIPVTELAWCAAIAARKAEPLESRKDLAAYESGRAFIRAIKAALLEGSLTTREQGSGIPINDKSWCLANDTLLSLPAMMPHDRLMLQTDEAIAWIKKMGIAIDAFPVLHLANQDITRVQPAPTGDQTKSATEPALQRGARLAQMAEDLGGRSKPGVMQKIADKENLTYRNVKRILDDHNKRTKKNTLSAGSIQTGNIADQLKILNPR